MTTLIETPVIRWRREQIERTVGRIREAQGVIDEAAAEALEEDYPSRWLLVERSPRDSREYYLTTWRTQAEAAEGHIPESFDQAWYELVELIDLDKGERWTGEVTVRWTETPA